MAKTRITPNALRQLRVQHHYTVEEVASIIGVGVHRIVLWEQGIAIPISANLLKLCVLYKTLPEEIYPELCARFVKNRQLKHTTPR